MRQVLVLYAIISLHSRLTYSPCRSQARADLLLPEGLCPTVPPLVPSGLIPTPSARLSSSLLLRQPSLTTYLNQTLSLLFPCLISLCSTIRCVIYTSHLYA